MKTSPCRPFILCALVASLGLMPAMGARAQTFTSLYSFISIGGNNDAHPYGKYPYAGLVQGRDGNFYGTAEMGGTNNYGTAFQITTNGKLAILHSFTSGNDVGVNTDGFYPDSTLAQGTDGYLYGTTSGGGEGFGTVFKISTNGVLNSLYHFTGTGDGANPYAGLVPGGDGYFYGTTVNGGNLNLGNGNGVGTVFKISTNGVLTTLYAFGTLQDAFGDPLDGGGPIAGLVRGADGCFYGTTQFGGTNYNSAGTVFKINTNGVLTTLHSFYSFSGSNDGSTPTAGLVQGTDGYLYGTTSAGGEGYGTVFKISTDGTLTILYSFDGDETGNDGKYPMATMVRGRDGYFYGTTAAGGAYGGAVDAGTLFKISTDGKLTSLYSFTGGDDGAQPEAGLVQGSDGNFYGTTSAGGLAGAGSAGGTVFELTVVPEPPPELLITPAGTNVILSWSADATGFNLEFANNLVSPIFWGAISTAPVVISGQNVVTNPITGLQVFFRLSQ